MSKSKHTKKEPTIMAVEKQDRKGFLDRFQEKVVSRKLATWITSTVLLSLGLITPEIWMYISISYIASQGIADIVAKVKGR